MTNEEREKIALDMAQQMLTVAPSSFWSADDLKDMARAALAIAERRIREDCAEIAGQKSAMMPHDSDFTRGYASGRVAARADIAAIRPHIEAAERERCAKIAELHSYPMKTVAGTGYNNAAKEIAAAIRRGK